MNAVKGGGHAGEKKIFYLTRPAAGGMRRHLQQLIGYFSRDYTICLGSPESEERWDLTSLPAGSLFRLPLSSGLDLSGDLLTFRRLHLLLRRLRPVLLHIHGFRAALPGLAAARWAGVPVLVTIHNSPAHRAAPRMPHAAKFLGLHKVRYIAVSEALAGELAALGIPPGQISVIHNGIDPALYGEAAAGRIARRRAGGEIIVGTAARFAPQKGLPYFLQAAATLAPLFPEMRFLVIGDGPGRPALERQALQLGLTGRLSFCGYCSDLPRYLAGMDIFVLPSLTEGLPLVLLEAAAAGCAVVASAVGGIPEVITGGVHGLLVPPADGAALARAAAALARDPARARRLARACRRRVAGQFTLERMLSLTETLYEGLVGCSRDRVPELAGCRDAGDR